MKWHLKLLTKDYIPKMVFSLTQQQLSSYQTQGFLILENFIDEAMCDSLITRAKHLVEKHAPTTNKTLFSTRDHAHAKTQYFLASGDKIHCFFEEAAQPTDDQLLTINKIGHALHDLDEVFQAFSFQTKISDLATALNLQNARIVQSMYIFKQPRIGGEVTCHQDSSFLYTEHETLTGLWIALEAATLENGCLWAIPGAHRAPLKSRMLREQDNIRMEVFDETPWALNEMIPLPVTQGSLILLHGRLPHMSKKNTSPHSRHAFTLHLMCQTDTFSAQNWLQRKSFSGFNN